MRTTHCSTQSLWICKFSLLNLPVSCGLRRWLSLVGMKHTLISFPISLALPSLSSHSRPLVWFNYLRDTTVWALPWHHKTTFISQQVFLLCELRKEHDAYHVRSGKAQGGTFLCTHYVHDSVDLFLFFFLFYTISLVHFITTQINIFTQDMTGKRISSHEMTWHWLL